MSGRSTEERLRLFVAAELPAHVRAEVKRWQRVSFSRHDDLRSSANLHVTLSFLGDTPAASVERIKSTLAAIRMPALPVALGEPFFLPRRGRKSVVALRVLDPSGALVRLQHMTGEALIDVGVLKRERRDYLAHLTVARFRRPGQAFALQNVNVEGFGLPSVILYSSVPEKGGAVHTPLATFPVS